MAFAGIPNLEDTEALKAYLAPGGNPVLPHLPLSPYIDKVVQANNFIHSPTVDLYRVKRILDCDVHAPLYDVRYRKPLLEFGERLEAVAANLLTMQVVTVEPKEVAQDLLH